MTTPAHKKRAVYSVPPDAEKTFKVIYEPYASALGHAIIAWNRLHESLGGLFDTTINSRVNRMGFAIWHASDSDRVMRDALDAAATTAFQKKKKELLKDIQWLLREVGELSGDRNTATHALLIIARATEGFTVVPDTAMGHAKSARLKEKDLLREFTSCEARASELSLFAQALRSHMRDPSMHPWPHKPGPPHFSLKQTQAEQRQKKADKLRQRQQ